MAETNNYNNHYETLKVRPDASQAEIKQAYRRLVKVFHPDSNQETSDSDAIIRINAAYEVLGDVQNRQNYDQKLRQRSDKASRSRQQRTASAQKQYQTTRQTGKEADEQIEEWLHFVYQPVNRLVYRILYSLKEQIEKLSADPFDDVLLDEFQDYLDACRDDLKQAQTKFRSLPNPPSLARTAAHLYYCLNQIGDGLDELKYYPLNYDENYLHTGQEMFRIANRLYREAQESMRAYA
ncbi:MULTISPECIES: J domain-containing protein [Nostocales]|uniref:DnaJ domain-containing protein n=3 Tax=Nostocales TaxID=1161 RepID=A0A0C1QX37_9CYAN|nr:J domain-containing protein [Tolypothrix bouteillei]KAF3885759.1 DnaJ domain-containing protein [Tolypothrix bouteillei VB521301]